MLFLQTVVTSFSFHETLSKNARKKISMTWNEGKKKSQPDALNGRLQDIGDVAHDASMCLGGRNHSAHQLGVPRCRATICCHLANTHAPRKMAGEIKKTRLEDRQTDRQTDELKAAGRSPFSTKKTFRKRFIYNPAARKTGNGCASVLKTQPESGNSSSSQNVR